MKKILPALVLISLLALPMVTSAQAMWEPPCKLKHDLGVKYPKCAEVKCGTKDATCTDAVCCVIDVIETAVDWAFVILLALAGLFIVIGGFMFVTAGGDVNQIAKARNYLMYALIGVAIAFLAKGFVRIVYTIIS